MQKIFHSSYADSNEADFSFNSTNLLHEKRANSLHRLCLLLLTANALFKSEFCFVNEVAYKKGGDYKSSSKHEYATLLKIIFDLENNLSGKCLAFSNFTVHDGRFGS